MSVGHRELLGGLLRPYSLYVMLAISLLLPATIAVALQAYYGFRAEAEETRMRAVSAADNLVLLADARATSDLSALRLLSRSRYFVDGDADAGARRAQEAVEMIPGWRAVYLANRRTGELIFEATADQVGFTGRFERDLLSERGNAVIGGVEREGRHCPCVYLQVALPRDRTLALTAVVDPVVYQSILLSQLPAESVAGIVDREGEFLARSLDYAQRVGTPATSFVREAVARGGRDIYEGTTYENLRNYTAYTTSELTGWSGHVAIDNSLLDGPLRRASAVVSIGTLFAIVAGTLLFLLAAREAANQKRNEEKMLELQRSEAVAQFTATVVHDFRNVIATLRSGLNLIKRKTDNAEIGEHIALIEKSLGKGTRLANQLLSFSHGNDAVVEAIELSGVLEDMRYLLEQAAGAGIKLSIAPPPYPTGVMANRDQLELALLNLVINAKDATEGKGRVDVRVAEAGDYVEISVSDDGPGVPKDLRQSVFTPFTTHKPHGTGLGLAQVAGMARTAGGSVDLRDGVGEGATFVISLPRADAAEHQAEPQSSSAAE